MPATSDDDRYPIDPDVTLKCGDGEGWKWKVHGGVVSLRSKWFKALLRGNFKETATKVVVLEGHDPEVINVLLHWIYNRHMPVNTKFFGLLANPETYYATCVEIWRTADFLRIDDIRDEIFGRLVDRLRKKAAFVRRAYRENANPFYHHQRMTSGLRASVEAAYEMNLARLTEMFVKFVEDTGFQILQDAEFRGILDHVPKFAVDIVKSMPSSPCVRLERLD